MYQLRELAGYRGWEIHPYDVSADSRVGLVREKLRQADTEALDDSGLGRIAVRAGLVDLKYAIAKL